MPGPARAGLFVYALDLHRVARFYEAVANMSRLHETPELVVLESPDIQLLVHQIPAHIAADITISSPPQKREDTALKFFVTVDSVAAARATASTHGGEVFAECWQGPGFIACNAMDPEGNIFQIREQTSAAA